MRRDGQANIDDNLDELKMDVCPFISPQVSEGDVLCVRAGACVCLCALCICLHVFRWPRVWFYQSYKGDFSVSSHRAGICEINAC